MPSVANTPGINPLACFEIFVTCHGVLLFFVSKSFITHKVHRSGLSGVHSSKYHLFPVETEHHDLIHSSGIFPALKISWTIWSKNISQLHQSSIFPYLSKHNCNFESGFFIEHFLFLFFFKMITGNIINIYIWKITKQ